MSEQQNASGQPGLSEDAPSPSAQAASLVMNWQEADLRAFAFYMCGFAPTEVIYYARSLTADGEVES